MYLLYLGMVYCSTIGWLIYLDEISGLGHLWGQYMLWMLYIFPTVCPTEQRLKEEDGIIKYQRRGYHIVLQHKRKSHIMNVSKCSSCLHNMSNVFFVADEVILENKLLIFMVEVQWITDELNMLELVSMDVYVCTAHFNSKIQLLFLKSFV